METRMGTSTYKVPGGKLIRIDAVFSDRVERVKITGDFFLHPEEALDEIEACLDGAPLPLDQNGLARRIAACLEERRAELLGVAPEDIVATLAEAVR